MNTKNYLDRVKARLGITSDYALAKALGVTRQAVSRYYRAGGGFDDEVCKRIGEILGIHPAFIVIEQHKGRAQSDDVRHLWEEIEEGFRVPLLLADRGRALRPPLR